MVVYHKSVDKVYEPLHKCIIIGLTGRTGSGCSTAAAILEKKDFENLNLSIPKRKDFTDIEERKDAIIFKYMNNNKWIPFVTIEVSSVILSVVFQKTYDEFKAFLDRLVNNDLFGKSISIRGYEELLPRLESIKSYFNSKYAKFDTIVLDSIKDDKDKIGKYYQYFSNEIKVQKRIFADLFKDYSCTERYSKSFEKQKEQKSQLYTYLLQLFGNNIRSSGDPFSNDFIQGEFSNTAERIETIINLIIRKNELESKNTRICVDAIRNPYEAYYLKDKFSSFYLVSVSTDDDERRRRLIGFDQYELKTMDDMEYPVDFEKGRIFFQQSIEECLQVADIHLYNPVSPDKTYKLLTRSLVRYIALMLRPGLVTPTNIERCMQVAYTAKLNSGCLSRQVGAVITDAGYYIKAIGWNEVPQGQISCGLRTVENYLSERDDETFSKFELENEKFQSAIQNVFNEFDHCECEECSPEKTSIFYCFKDIINSIQKNKNQVYTRSLHAEENAFLQASKFGGQGILGGKLFVTASPCELCSKKSYQLGIREIYYIDPYPGIATSHILKLGKKPTNPDLHIFYGAIGSAYVSMYSQRFATKDELQLLSGVNMKKVSAKEKIESDNEYELYHYKSVNLSLVFSNRYDVDFYNDTIVTPIKENMSHFSKSVRWTGSSFGTTVITTDNPAYSISDEDCGEGIHNYIFKLEKECCKGDDFHYAFKTSLKDDQGIMKPYFCYKVMAETDKLSLCVRFMKIGFKKMPTDARLVLYADQSKKIIYQTTELTLDDSNPDYYEISVKDHMNPNLLYTYAIEWIFQ